MTLLLPAKCQGLDMPRREWRRWIASAKRYVSVRNNN
jgi:hypothetical protein